MPKLDGPGALGRIRASQGPNQTTPVLAFTAEVDESFARELRARGFQEVVKKPVEPAALIAAVARAAAGAQARQAIDDAA